ncbi:hypothetical protein LTR27_006311 [Elasticomyces elasticus]|nr:hypothetical protein LTR27_006311 [Elasticomyces elasticus]
MSFFRRKRSEGQNDISQSSSARRESVGTQSGSRRSFAVEEEDSVPKGLIEWASGTEPVVDLVFVHGLNGHREKTWTADNHVFWPKDLLAHDLPNARLLAFGYDSRTHAPKDLSRQTFHGHATTLLQVLSLYRRKTKVRRMVLTSSTMLTRCFLQTVRRPIIFVAHSMGGLVVKSALIHANLTGKNDTGNYKAIHVSTYGIIFFGTPHQGGNGVSFGKIIATVASIAIQTNTALLNHLEKDSEWLEQQLGQYALISGNIHHKFCYETVPTMVAGVGSMMIVNKSSAIVPNQSKSESIEIYKNHIQMVKMRSREDADYSNVSSHMELMVEEAPNGTELVWLDYDRSNAPNDVNTQKVLNAGQHSITDNYTLELRLGYKQNSIFTGREQALNDLHDLLTSPGRLPDEARGSPIVVHGTGGVGKTQLARQYAYLRHKSFTSVSWINCTSIDTTYASFHTLARRLVEHYATKNKASIPPFSNLAQHLGLHGLIDQDGVITWSHTSRDSVVEAVKKWLSRPDNIGWLVIFDNFDDLDSYDIASFFPDQTGNGRILITTRRRECARLGIPMELDVLDHSESTDLLKRSCQRRGSFSEQERYHAEEIGLTLGHLPLALDQAGAYMFTTQTPFEEYLQLLDDSRIKATLSHKPPSSVWQYSKSVFTTWELSFKTIEESNPQSAELLLLCSFFSNTEIYPDMLEKGLRVVDPKGKALILNAALPIRMTTTPLFSFSLIARKLVEDHFSIHPLVHSWARERMDLQTKTQMASKAFRVLCASLGSWEIWTTGVRQPQHWEFERRIAPHITSILKWVRQLLPEEDVSSDLAAELMSLAHTCFYEGRYNEADELYSRVLASAKKTFGEDHPEYLARAQGAATVARFTKDMSKSQRLYEAVLKARMQIDPDGLETLATVQSLAVVYRHRGRLDDAVRLYQWALYGHQASGNGLIKQQGPQHPNTIHTILGYAIVLQHQGKYEDAMIRYRDVLAYREARLSPEHPDSLTAKQNLADVTRRIGDLKSAEILFGQVLDARENLLGPMHPDTLRTADGLANVYRDQHQFEKSADLYSQALQGREQIFGSDHLDTLATIHNIAESYVMQGKTHEARALFLRALEGREQQNGHHLDTFRSIVGLGDVARAERRFVEAEKQYSRAVSGLQSQMAPECIDLVAASAKLADVRAKLGRGDVGPGAERKHSPT